MALLLLVAACRDHGHGSDDESSSGSGSDGGTSSGGATIGSSSIGDTSGSSSGDSGNPSSGPESSSDSSTGEEQHCGDGNGAAGETCFAPAQILLENRPTAAVALADVDLDGDLDLVAGHLDGFSTWLGDGSGTLGEPFGEDSDPIGAIAIATVDDDEWPDLVAAHPQHDRVSVRMGVGDGSFGVPIEIAVDGDGTMGNASPRGVAVSDLDGDGDTDVAVVSELDAALRIFFQDGGGFDVMSELDGGGTPVAIAIGSLTEGPGPDLAIANFAGASVALFEHAGGTTWDPGASLAVGAGPRGLAALDLDEDGATDLVTADAEGGTASILLRAGPDFAAALVLAVGAQPRAIAAGDFDNDGHVDVALALETQNAIGVLLRDGGADEFAMLPAAAVGTHARPDSIAAGDLNDDGISDVVTGSAAAGGGVALLLGDP